MGHYTLTTVQVAVKSFRFPFSLGEIQSDKDDSRDEKDQKSIRRELGIWRRLKHPNIVPFLGVAYGFGRPGQASLVSLWMANGSLQSFLGQHGDQLTIAHRLQLLLDIANGLCYLHSFAPTPFIHGDLSSHNVLLDRNYNARLTDFGYASMIGDNPEASLSLQMTTMKPGALRWAVPEHFLVGEEQTLQPTTQSDIYSFGNLGLLVLSGKQPWSEIQREPAVIVQLSQGLKPKRPSSPPIEDQYWELIEHCWSSVGERPGAGDVVSSLQQFLRPYPPPLPLADIFCAPSRSSRPAVHYMTILEPNVYPPGLSPATLGHQNGVFRDGKYIMSPMFCFIQLTPPQTLQTLSLHMTSNRRQVQGRQVIQDLSFRALIHDLLLSQRDQEVVTSTSEEPNPALRNSSAGTVSDDALRTNKE
ncbi:kinase-like domain-containing protein [Boletus reticuloceps]|uniref:Kinase-like domain-containing protein n=1 Tax=Boletus reticuloceps TaxID=495285 RepID=A0A8I2YYM0_9AGAM|nr:kinase-like domain-containing protein [Boletus reticuloceps]